MNEQGDQGMEIESLPSLGGDDMDEDGDLMESDDLKSTIPTKRQGSKSPEPEPDAQRRRVAPDVKKIRQRPRYDGNAPDGLALVDAYERGTMAKSRKKAREELKRKQRASVAHVDQGGA